jgi:glucose dehydrogenase
MSPPITLRVQIEPPSETGRNPAGVIVKAVAFVEPNGTLVVRDRGTGKPLGTTKVKHGDNFAAAARGVVLRSQQGPSSFWNRDI